MERNTGEPFDYAAEDRIIEAYHKFKAAVEAIDYPFLEGVAMATPMVSPR